MHEEAWRDYAFQMFLPVMRLLVMTPGLAKVLEVHFRPELLFFLVVDVS